MTPISADVFDWRMRHAFGYQKRKEQSEPDCTAQPEPACTKQGERSPDFEGVTLPPIRTYIAAQEQLESLGGLPMHETTPRVA